ncbi:MAG: flavin reductase [Clostridia bacterium]|nr:flavin reductase [Clostridia bacterium]
MFKETSVFDLKQNVFEEIHKNWMLVSAAKPDGTVNTMTASWGAMGELWNKETVTVYIRESRYTKEFIDAQEYFTVSLFDGHRKELTLLGRRSGRDGDKIAEAGFHTELVGGQPAFAESKCVLVCKKIYETPLDPKAIPEEYLAANYANGDYHTMYIGEVVACYVNE